MRTHGHAQAAVLERGVLERIPKGHRARRVRETDAAVLMGRDATAHAGLLGDDLALRDARVEAAEQRGDGAIESGVRYDVEGWKVLVDAAAEAGDQARVGGRRGEGYGRCGTL